MYTEKLLKIINQNNQFTGMRKLQKVQIS